MNFLKGNLNKVFMAAILIVIFIALFQLSNNMEQPIQVHSVNYHVLSGLTGPAPRFYGGMTGSDVIEEAYDITYISPKRFDRFVSNEDIAIMGLRDGRALYFLTESSTYFTIYDANPAFYHAVKATDIKETPGGVVMIFERDWLKMFILFSALSIIINGLIYIVAAVLSQEEKFKAETKST